MPGRYQAQPQSIYGQPGAPLQPRAGVDVAGALDALTSGATSLIHQQMLRRNAENEIAARNAEIEARKQQIALEQQRESREAQAQQDAHNLAVTSERHRFIEAGGIPAHTETQAVAGQAQITPITPTNPQPTPVRRAMTAGLPDASAIGGPSLTPTDTGQPAAIPGAQPQTATVYHP